MKQFRFHIPAVPHTVTNKKFISCAYTQKVYKLCTMLIKLGHEVYHYGCEGSNPECTENIEIVSEEFRKKYYSTNYHIEQFKFNTQDKYHIEFYKNCVNEIKKRQKPRDFLLCAWGWGHEPIARHFDLNMLIVESGVGYENVFAKYRVFESYTWMAHVYGLNNIKNGNWYDAVIPNFFDPNDFTYSDQKEDWYLYLGRITHRKGVDIAVQATEAINAKLRIAGQGTLQNEQENVFITADHIDHVGFADQEKRRQLLSRAKAVFIPTFYIEPFGGVSIEAAMSGTPVISSDWGVFGENVLHGITGYRCRTLEQFCWAAENINDIQSINCHNWGISNFNLDRISLMYQEYFEMLYQLWDKGWYSKNEQRSNLNWLSRDYPFFKSDKTCIAADKLNLFTPKERLAKIAFWTHVEWAFGRISEGLKKSLIGIYEIEIFNWLQEYSAASFESFDLIYIPTWPDRQEFLKRYPTIPQKKVVCGIHGIVELFNIDIQTGRKKEVLDDDIKSLKISDPMVQLLKAFPAIGVVNKRILEWLRLKYGLSNLFLTECGVDIEKFNFPEKDRTDNNFLKIMYPVRIPEDMSGTHGYNVKRFHLVKKVQEAIKQEFNDVDFILPNEIIPYAQMPTYYQKADVHLCFSQSEGGPLVALESAACGLIQICTNVGVISDLLESGVSGYIIDEDREDEMVDQVIHYLRHLKSKRTDLPHLKRSTRKSIERDWTWESKRDQWISFFESALSNLSNEVKIVDTTKTINTKNYQN